MDIKYNHKEVEVGKHQKWVDKKYFVAKEDAKQPFCIILPPPNVTGQLHLGHAWDSYIQDTIIRFKKLNGFDVLFLPGTDHAGIATQAKVEEKLFKEEGIKRSDLGKTKFLEQVWKWKEHYAEIIRQQWAKLGLGLDYTRERFTLDTGLSTAVKQVFINMHQKGLIYKGKRAINWDPVLQTVLSNIEVIPNEIQQIMYYFNYKLKEGGVIQIATTRPETMFSDVAIAINPDHPSMKKYIGKIAISPLTGRELPILAVKEILIDKGTGAMKVSAHAEMDIAIINAHKLEVIECIDKSGRMNNIAEEFEGLDRFETREKVVAKLDDSLVKTETHISNVGHSERSGAVVETLVQPQWFVKMQPLADKVIINLKSQEKVEFFPSRFGKTLQSWLSEIHDWCISRQLWWGHQIPAWYKNDEIKVQIESPGPEWIQDEDVLDTWFSSALAPFSFLGWPQDNKVLQKFYPTSLLVTGYDIIFFWVSRMYFQGLEFMKQIPFQQVLIHGLVRAEDGQKMSKSLGNGINPMDVIEKNGSDALRYFLLTNSTPGLDLRYSQEKVEAAWNLNNKLWNISRYIIEIMKDESKEITFAEKWIYNKLAALEQSISTKMDSYEFTIIGKELTSFIVDDFSSWYIEFSKVKPNRQFSLEILAKFLIIAHPFLPFITDHLYKLATGQELLEANWPTFKLIPEDSNIDQVIKSVIGIREFKAAKGIGQTEEIEFWPSIELSKTELSIIQKLTNASLKENYDALVTLNGFNIYIKLSDELRNSEKIRLEKELQIVLSEIKRAKGMLSNQSFASKAPKEKIEEEKEKLNKYKNKQAELIMALKKIK